MALISCVDCEHAVSTLAQACRCCGRPTAGPPSMHPALLACLLMVAAVVVFYAVAFIAWPLVPVFAIAGVLSIPLLVSRVVHRRRFSSR